MSRQTPIFSTRRRVLQAAACLALVPATAVAAPNADPVEGQVDQLLDDVFAGVGMASIIPIPELTATPLADPVAAIRYASAQFRRAASVLETGDVAPVIAPAVLAPQVVSMDDVPVVPTLPITVEPIAPVVEAVPAEPAQPVVIAGGKPVAVAALVPEVEDDGSIRLMVNDTRVITTSRPFHRVAIAKDTLATVQPLSPTQLLVTAHEPGTTQMIFWDAQEQAQTLLLQTSADLREAQGKVEQLLPNERIEVVDLGAGRIALTGTVSGVDVAAKAERIVNGYGQVENFLELAGKQQVSLKIRFAEVSRTAGKQFGVNLGWQDPNNFNVIGSNVGGNTPFGFGLNPNTDVIDRLGIPLDPSNATQLFGLFGNGDDTFSVLVSALRDANLLRVLADPELTVLSGEEATFLAGGSYPVPVPQEEGIAIEYREFGIKLAYSPIVLGDGRIRMQLMTEVSDLDESIGVTAAGTRVPGERTRQTGTTVELLEGQTLAISGLLRSRTVANKQGVPLLGDVPVLGSLFRSVRYQREETELVVLVTPRLVEALDEVPPLPGENWQDPNDIELMLFGQLGGVGGVSAPDEADLDGSDDRAKAGPPRLQSSYAFIPPEPVAD
jgi:pilus assembly protein CpaC